MQPRAAPEPPALAGFAGVAELLRRHARDFPRKLALCEADGGQQMDFAGLQSAVEQSALALRALGVRAGDRVVLAAETGLAKLVTWLALWQSGAVVCPLDPAFLRHAAEELMAAIEPQWVVHDETASVRETLLADDGEAVPVIRFAQRLSDAGVAFDADTATPPGLAAEPAPWPEPRPEDLACIACTSGTTGSPKIVLYDHQALWLNGRDTIALLGLRPCDRQLEYRSLNWYSSQILSLMPFLQLGLSLFVARRFSLSRFEGWVRRHGLTVSVGVPTVIQLLLKQADAGSPANLDGLRLMTSSTAPLAAHHWRRFEAVHGVPVMNLYGSTETGWISGNRPDNRKLGSVGRLLDSVRVEDMPDAAAGGLLSVSTPKLALGYLSRGGRVHALRGQPFTLQDVVRFDAEGFLHVLGRADELIIRGGVKISPVEIEAVVSDHPAVADAGVVGVPDEVLGSRIVCFVVPAAGSTDLDGVLAHCRKMLPREKVPARLLPIAKLPRSDRGKILRRHLAMLARNLD